MVKIDSTTRLLDVPQLSRVLQVKDKTIYGWVHKKCIPYFKVGRLLRFETSDIEQWLKTKARGYLTSGATM